MFPSFIFHKSNSLIGRLIRKATNSTYSHVALCLDEFHLIQLDWKTPVSVQHFTYPKGSYDVYYFNLTLTDKEKIIIIKFIKDNLSTTYDFKFIFSRLFHILFGTKIVSAKDKYTCDELIVEAFREIGINLVNKDVMLSPETLAKSKYLTKVNY